MEERTYAIAALIVLCGSYVRVLWVTGAAFRTFQDRTRFRRFQMGWVEAIAVPEPFFLVGVTSFLAARQLKWTGGSLAEASGAAVGAALVLAALALTVWSYFSWRSLFVGHGVLDDHRLVTSGAYGVVRHPVYVGVFLIWLGLALAFLSPVAFLIAAVYVIPIYVLYMRSEEKMMLESFGDAYRQYCQDVPMLIPRLRPRTGRV